MRRFFDCHFHVMTFKEPSFSAFLSALNPASITGAGAKDYIITPQSLLQGRLKDTIENTITTFSQPIGATFLMMEADLKGTYRRSSNKGTYPNLPYIRDGLFHFRGRSYEKIMLCPLLMDFSHNQSTEGGSYYPSGEADKITPYIRDTIQGIREYYEAAPDGLFEFYPLVGINPPVHSLSFLEDLLLTYVDTSHLIHKERSVAESRAFYGIKLYPPLGTDPWPEDKDELLKMRTLYRFCEENRIPIITHCDDQGFRGIPIKDAWRFTNPASWRSVLENYPSLIIDFAHVGKQYATLGRGTSIIENVSARMKKLPQSEWFYSLMKLMQDFDNVYTDISFTGGYPEFYHEMLNYLATLSDDERTRVEDRLLFGSDFSVNLLKVESYANYYNIVETSPFSDELVTKLSEINPMRFFGLMENNQVEDKRRLRLPFSRKN